MLFRQFVDDDLGCGSYLVGDPAVGEAVVVDPAFAIEPYLEAAEREGVRIVRVLETHTHADHLSGHGRFALEHGLPVAIHPLARPEYPFEPLEDGQVVRVGAVEIRVLHTPGHRPEHCAFLVGGELVLTGDSLFVGEAARPDLAVEARAGAADLFRSLRRLAALPAATAVYPGHVSGSLCGARMREDRSTSIGRERHTNHALRSGESAFVEESASIALPRPPTTERLVALNRGPWVGAPPPLTELEQHDGASLPPTVLDVRPAAAFAGGHRPGAISVALDGGSFATRAAFVLDPGEPFAIQARSREEALEAQRLLNAVGIFEAAGYVLAGGGATTPTLGVPALARLLEREDVQLVDVREGAESAELPLPGAAAIPYRLLRSVPRGRLDPSRPVYAICASGARATLAASLLARQGFEARAVVGGGVDELLRATARASA